MKKRFLNLMACAVFLAPVSSFCMEKPEDELSGPMKVLPKEMHINVLNNLSETTDIISLKRVHLYFCDFVKQNKKIVTLEISYNIFDEYKEFCNFNYWEYDYNKSVYFSLFYEDGKKAPLTLIYLGDVNIAVQSTEKRHIALPISIEEMTFFAKWLMPKPPRHDRSPYSSTSWGQNFDRFIPESCRFFDCVSIPDWGTPPYEKIVSSVDIPKPSIILDGSKFILKVMAIESCNINFPSHILGPSGVMLEYCIYPDNGS